MTEWTMESFRDYVISRAERRISEMEGIEAERDELRMQVAAIKEREADLLHTLHIEQAAHDRCRERVKQFEEFLSAYQNWS